ncbi:cupin domain-containing protein [Halorubrum kocurii]|uniref:Cupin n=1 Tax=Halorubrum kocurii JCM 14978 TaxID=1230456 RepID=M0PGJ6_9EURY|nr:cupin domain-containing protein [Halorubrum kocurii]EMA67900.1 cupin [Halorubrum kocurii JCM 14978]
MTDTTENEAADASGAVLKRGDEIEYDAVDAADGLRKGVLLDESDGAPNFAMRRFELAAGAAVPRHTNAVEHEQYVLAGEYVVGIGEEEHRVGPGDALLIPAGVEHWYRNEGEEPGAFICAVPNGDDEIELVE